YRYVSVPAPAPYPAWPPFAVPLPAPYAPWPTEVAPPFAARVRLRRSRYIRRSRRSRQPRLSTFV
ncbi:hypothetical protein JYU34_012479, partial [Plutella xylostella]